MLISVVVGNLLHFSTSHWSDNFGAGREHGNLGSAVKLL